MVRYHFNIHDGISIPDVEGVLLPTLGHARREAARIAGYMLMTQPGEFWDGHGWFVETTDDDGEVLFRLRFQSEGGALTADERRQGSRGVPAETPIMKGFDEMPVIKS